MVREAGQRFNPFVPPMVRKTPIIHSKPRTRHNQCTIMDSLPSPTLQRNAKVEGREDEVDQKGKMGVTQASMPSSGDKAQRWVFNISESKLTVSG